MIRENYLFRRLYHRGKSQPSSCFVIYWHKRRDKNKNRLGITTTKKIGKAVTRNRARRVLLESYRLLESEFPSGMDIVLVARGRCAHVKMQVVKAELSRVLGKF